MADWYLGWGYTLIAANWRCEQGELDLVLESPGGGPYVFCEVKARSSTSFGTPFDSVTPVKQRRLRRLAARWLAQRRASGDSHETRFRPVRFDVAAVGVDRDGSLAIDVLQDAF